jgi:hypothetical protein
MLGWVRLVQVGVVQIMSGCVILWHGMRGRLAQSPVCGVWPMSDGESFVERNLMGVGEQ